MITGSIKKDIYTCYMETKTTKRKRACRQYILFQICVVNLEIIIKQNRVYVKNANLGENFSDLLADLTVDKYGRVKVKIRSNLSFNTNLPYLPSTILTAVSERLEKKERNKNLLQIGKKIKSALDVGTIQKI